MLHIPGCASVGVAIEVRSHYLSLSVDVEVCVICDSFKNPLWLGAMAATLLLRCYGGQGDVENITLIISLQKSYCAAECSFPICFHSFIRSLIN